MINLPNVCMILGIGGFREVQINQNCQNQWQPFSSQILGVGVGWDGMGPEGLRESHSNAKTIRVDRNIFLPRGITGACPSGKCSPLGLPHGLSRKLYTRMDRLTRENTCLFGPFFKFCEYDTRHVYMTFCNCLAM